VEGKSEHHLNRPWAVALHQQHLFIADNGNHRVQVFSTETGKLVKSINKWTTIGAGNSEEMTLSHPSGLLIEGDNLYVAELGNKRVSVFSATEFTYRGYFGKKGDASGCFQVCILSNVSRRKTSFRETNIFVLLLRHQLDWPTGRRHEKSASPISIAIASQCLRHFKNMGLGFFQKVFTVFNRVC
jgi:DNA-binding beta-propeller fold protein YncE